MAFYDKILSFHWIGDSDEITCRLLLARRIRCPHPHTIRSHSHRFWQLEICTRGEFLFTENEYSQRIKKGEFILIPPLRSHKIEYRRKDTEWLTLKFEVNEFRKKTAVYVGNTNDSAANIIAAVCALLGGDVELSHEILLAIENTLAGLVRYIHSETSNSTSLTDRIISLVNDSINQPISIVFLAEKLNLSVNYITTTFKKNTGLPLKRYIDNRRFENACRLLLLTAFSISEIALQAGFNDVFSFSRFFKRMAKVSPLKYRNNPESTI